MQTLTLAADLRARLTTTVIQTVNPDITNGRTNGQPVVHVALYSPGSGRVSRTFQSVATAQLWMNQIATAWHDCINLDDEQDVAWF